MNKIVKIEKIKDRGYKVKILGKNIRATKGDNILIGSVNKVFKELYGY